MSLTLAGNFSLPGYQETPSFDHSQGIVQPNPVNPQAGNQPVVTKQAPVTQTQQQSSPLDKFAFMLDNGQQVQNQQQPQNTQQTQQQTKQKQPQVFDVADADLLEVVKKVDTSGFVDDNAVKAILGANATPQQIQGMKTFMGSFAQNLLGQAIIANKNLAAAGVTQKVDDAQSGILGKITYSNAKATVLSQLPQLNNPVHASLLDNALTRMQTAKPELSAQELSSFAVEYFKTLGIEGKQQDTTNTRKPNTIQEFFNF